MRFSVWPSPANSWDDLLTVARRAEAAGWDGVWFADHFMPNAEDVSGPMHECWATLAGLAASVPRVRLGALVAGNTYRHPAVLAKTVTTIDHISGGRIVLGLGAGWQENEHRAYGIDFFDTRTRLRRLEEACEVIKGLTTQDRTTFEGSHYRLAEAPLEPKPLQQPLPLLVGGGGEKVTMRIAATWADEWNVWGTPETLAHKNAVLDGHCDALGRDPGTIARSAQGLLFMSDDESWLREKREQTAGGMPALVGTPGELVDVVGAYQEAGVDELIIPDFNLGPLERRLDIYDRFFAEVAGAFRPGD